MGLTSTSDSPIFSMVGLKHTQKKILKCQNVFEIIIPFSLNLNLKESIET